MIAPPGSPSNDDNNVPLGAEKVGPSSAAPENRLKGGSSPSSNRRNRALQIGSLILASLVGLILADGAIRLLDLMPLQRQAATQPKEAADDAAGEESASRLMVHPFRGFTPRPGQETEETSRWLSRSNVFGIRSMVADPRTIDPGDVVVGIFGGSVARGTSFRGGEALRQTILEVHPELQDSLRIVNFAASGYKQPQQLYLLSELLLLGVPIDVVVNIDGFNEIALGGTDAGRGYHPLYPQRNVLLTTLGFARGTLSTHQIELTAEIMRLRKDTESGRAALSRLPLLHRSALIQSALGSYVLAKERKSITLEEVLRSESEGDPEQAVFDLPDPCLDQEDDCRQLIADIWKRSSEQMRAVAENSGASYLHFLQPNQYVADSKPLSDEELDIAWAPQRPWSRAATSGYSFLQSAGRGLVADGVDFHDLSLIFQNHQETIYRDVCCHYNQRGYEILGREIGRAVGQRLVEHGARVDDSRLQ